MTTLLRACLFFAVLCPAMAAASAPPRFHLTPSTGVVVLRGDKLQGRGYRSEDLRADMSFVGGDIGLALFPWLVLEGGYLQSSTASQELKLGVFSGGNSNAEAPQSSGKFSFRLNSARANIRLLRFFGSRFGGSLGLGIAENKLDIHHLDYPNAFARPPGTPFVPPGSRVTQRFTRTSWLARAGASYRFTPRLAGTLFYDYSPPVDFYAPFGGTGNKAHVHSLGLGLRFGFK